MSNNLKLQVLLTAVDRATRPFKAVQNATKALSSSIRETRTTIKELDAQAGKIDGFRKTSAQLAITQQKLKAAKAEAQSLAVEFRNTERPTTLQAKALEKARQAASQLQSKTNGLRLSVQQQREQLAAAGISTRTLSSEQQRLKTASAQATASLGKQKLELQQLARQQDRVNQAGERFRKGQELSGKVRNMGAAGVGMATVGGLAEAALLKPGYEFAQANSTLQATLGLDKNSPEFASLKTQARSIGDNTAASANDAALAQIIIAKAGGSVDDIKAATPVTLNMSLANNRSMEESAKLLMSTKNAFGMANSEVAHLGDVISATLNKTAADFDGLNDALTYIAPVAKNAGVSVEQTTAMIGALAKSGTTGSMAGTGVRAMLLRAQAPTGAAYKAITELGVKTSDSKGNMRPFFTILKEMQKSFEKNKLGSAQQAEYLKTIFGEEAASSAVTLMQAASSGLLDDLTRSFKGSDGSTEKLVKVQQDNLGGDFKEFQSAYEAIGTDLFDRLDSSLRTLTQDTTKFLLRVDGWIQRNPELAGGLAKVATGGIILVGALGAFGLAVWPVITGVNALVAGAGLLAPVFSFAGTAITAALSLVTGPVLAIAAAVIAGVLLIRKYWEPICAFVGGAVAGFVNGLAPLWDAFSPLGPIFDAVTGKIAALWDWFGKLLEPVKLTQGELQSAGDMGKKFGSMLAAGLRIALNPMDSLREGIKWVLEKLGLIDSKSEGLNEKANQLSSAASGGATGLDPSLEYNPALGGAGYRPVTAAAGGNGYTDQSQNTYQYEINMHPGMTKDDAMALMAQHSDQQRRKAQAAQRSRYAAEDIP